MVVPSRYGGDRVPTVGTPPGLALPQGEQGFASSEGGGHLGGEALLEIRFPPGIVGIGPVRDFGMASDGETVRLKELYGLALSGGAADFSREHPVMSTYGGKVAGLHPADAFIGMPSFGPAPQGLKDRMIDRLEDLGANGMPVIQCPAPDERVQKADQGPGSGALVRSNHAPDFSQEGLDTLHRWLNEQLTVIFAEVLAEEVRTLVD